MKEEILTYLNTHSRNKVVFHLAPIGELQSHDIGVLLSEAIKGIIDDSRLSLKVSILIDEILNSCKRSHPEFGDIIAIENVGILLETDLKQDFGNLIRKYSDTNTLFINWNGVIEKDHLYFVTKETGKKIDIKNLSHITI